MKIYPSDRHQEIQDAIKQLRSGQKKKRRTSWRKLIDWWETTPIEKSLETAVRDLRQLAFFDLLALITNITIIISLWSFIAGAEDRQKGKHYQAWDVINSAIGEEAESGRKAAIEDLAQDGVSLSGLNIEKAQIPGLALSSQCHIRVIQIGVFRQLCQLPLSGWLTYAQRADLVAANLQEAYLERANLQGADLTRANLQEALFWRANLQEADLKWANLRETSFWRANLQEADLKWANLQEADLILANLQAADLGEANLQEAVLKWANLQAADLGEANLQGTVLLGANLSTARGLETAQLKGEAAPYFCGTRLPSDIVVSANRDCEKVAEVLFRRYPDIYPSLKYAQGEVEGVLKEVEQNP